MTKAQRGFRFERLKVVGAALASLSDAQDEPVHQTCDDAAHDGAHPVHLQANFSFNITTICIIIDSYYLKNYILTKPCDVKKLFFMDRNISACNGQISTWQRSIARTETL